MGEGRGEGLVLALLALCACTEPWREVPYVEGLRVLAVRAEPPDLAPGQLTSLDALVVDPRAPARPNTLVWLACDPDPANPDQPACAQTDTIQQIQGGDLADLAALQGAGVRLLGMSLSSGPFAFPVIYQSPADVFAQVAPDDARRTKGVLAIVLMLAVAGVPEHLPPTSDDLTAMFAKVRGKQLDSLLTIKRLRISENPEKNHNPKLSGVSIGTETWAPGPHVAKVLPGVRYRLLGLSPDGAAETYSEIDVDGKLVQKTEHLIVSWFTTCGDLWDPRLLEVDPAESIYLPFILQKLPADRLGDLWLVLRDGRGGVDMMVRPFYLCDLARTAPTIASVSPSSGPPGTPVEVRGEGLDDLLDVELGARFLADGHWDATAGAWVGTVPADASTGLQRLVARGKGCDPDPEGSFEVTAP